MSETPNQNFENNGVNRIRPLGEGSPSSRCFLVQQRELIFHQVTAGMKWNKKVNKVVMEYFYRSKRFDEEEKPVECLENGEIEDSLNRQSSCALPSKSN